MNTTLVYAVGLSEIVFGKQKLDRTSNFYKQDIMYLKKIRNSNMTTAQKNVFWFLNKIQIKIYIEYLKLGLPSNADTAQEADWAGKQTVSYRRKCVSSYGRLESTLRK